MSKENDDVFKDVSKMSLEQQIADGFVGALTKKIKNEVLTADERKILKKIVSDFYEVKHSEIYKMIRFEEQPDNSYLVSIADGYVEHVKKELEIKTDTQNI